MTPPAVHVRGVRKVFRTTNLLGAGKGRVVALDDVEFRLEQGEFAALVGESGSGKTTLGRVLLGLEAVDAGRVEVLGADVGALGRRALKAFRRDAQIVFQNPYASLNPAFPVRATLAEAVRVHRDLTREEVNREVETLAEQVHLPRARLDEYPTSLSGGERRRVSFGRALATRPRFVVTDEPVAGLDPPIQAQLLDLLQRVHARRDITFLFVSHDLRVVRALATRVLVLYRGRLVENAPAKVFFSGGAQHPYSLELLRSAFDAPRCIGQQRGMVSLTPVPAGGCAYRVRCPHPDIEPGSPCATISPPLRQIGAEHWVACHLKESA